MATPAVRAAIGRMMCVATGVNPLLDPVGAADIRTSVNDARTALCIAAGVPLDQIHPASGHDLQVSK